jgi:hypothetical protein
LLLSLCGAAPTPIYRSVTTISRLYSSRFETTTRWKWDFDEILFFFSYSGGVFII